MSVLFALHISSEPWSLDIIKFIFAIDQNGLWSCSELFSWRSEAYSLGLISTPLLLLLSDAIGHRDAFEKKIGHRDNVNYSNLLLM
jgi:hypothetical protein